MAHLLGARHLLAPPEASNKQPQTHQSPRSRFEGIHTISRRTAFLSLPTSLHRISGVPLHPLRPKSAETHPSLSSQRMDRNRRRLLRYTSTTHNQGNSKLVSLSNGLELLDITTQDRTDRFRNINYRPRSRRWKEVAAKIPFSGLMSMYVYRF